MPFPLKIDISIREDALRDWEGKTFTAWFVNGDSVPFCSPHLHISCHSQINPEESEFTCIHPKLTLGKFRGLENILWILYLWYRSTCGQVFEGVRVMNGTLESIINSTWTYPLNGHSTVLNLPHFVSNGLKGPSRKWMRGSWIKGCLRNWTRDADYWRN